MNAIKNFFLGLWKNHRREVIAAVVVVLAMGLLLSRCASSGNSATTFPGGGAGMMVLAALASVGAAVRQSKGLWIVAAILWTIYLYPKAMAILLGWGVVPSIAFLLFLGMAWWIVKKGAGFFFWRGIVAVVLLFSVIPLSGIVNEGIKDLKKVEVPKPSMSQSLKDSFSRFFQAGETVVDGSSKKAQAQSAAKKTHDLAIANNKKSVYIEAGTPLYDDVPIFKFNALERLVGVLGTEDKNLNGKSLSQVILGDGTVYFVDPNKLVFAEVEARVNAEAEARVAAKEKADAEAKAQVLEKIRQDVEKQDAEKKIAEKERRAIMTLRPFEKAGVKVSFRLPEGTNYGDRFEFLEAVAVGSEGGISFGDYTEIKRFPLSTVPAGEVFTVPQGAVKKSGNFEIVFLSKLASDINSIKIKKKGGM